jgi:hypothetical protein
MAAGSHRPAAVHAHRDAAAAVDPLHRPFDQMLDIYVRDGYVYYRALQMERGRFDRYVASLDVAPATYERWTREQRIAFWLNAYNAFVLRTVINHYPIRGRAAEYPSNSIRQIPGAFDRSAHRAAGRVVSLDEVEQTILREFKDPRVYLALGRGAVGSGRLRSEAYSGGRLETQLAQVATEFARKPEYVRVDYVANQLTVSPIIGWQDDEFAAAYADRDTRFTERSPIERAILAFIEPHLMPTERAFLAKNAFRIGYHEFDWSLNDLTGGRR